MFQRKVRAPEEEAVAEAVVETAQAAVAGVRRAADNKQVLGARRGQTGDNGFNEVTARNIMIGAGSIAGFLILLARRRRKSREE